MRMIQRMLMLFVPPFAVVDLAEKKMSADEQRETGRSRYGAVGGTRVSLA
jgi:hypothetical protein